MSNYEKNIYILKFYTEWIDNFEEKKDEILVEDLRDIYAAAKTAADFKDLTGSGDFSYNYFMEVDLIKTLNITMEMFDEYPDAMLLIKLKHFKKLKCL